MATTTTPPPTSTPPNPIRTTPLLHNASLLTLFVCPLLIALPPRKLDIYTLGLMTCTFIGGNHLAYEYTGVTMGERIGRRFNGFTGGFGGALPEKARINQERLRGEMRRRGLDAEEKKGWFGGWGAGKKQKDDQGVLEEVKRLKEEKEKEAIAAKEGEEEREKQTVLKRVWLGGEGKDWKQKRDQREKEALEEGKGYGDLIMEQIWEVWSGGKTKMEEVKKGDEKALEERKEGKEGKK